MSDFVRPDIAAPVFHDADGQIIDYGNRWGNESPPDHAYSMDSHLERFLPLHTIADSLIDHLVSNFDVHVREADEIMPDEIRNECDDVIRAVRLTPNDERSAPMTFLFTSYPSVVLHAGLLHEFCYPGCGCDACDESWQRQADEMEWQVLAVANGNFKEYVESTFKKTWVKFQLFSSEGCQSGGSLVQDILPGRTRQTRKILEALPGRWREWPKRPR